jgi:hypothetical protein
MYATGYILMNFCKEILGCIFPKKNTIQLANKANKKR